MKFLNFLQNYFSDKNGGIFVQFGLKSVKSLDRSQICISSQLFDKWSDIRTFADHPFYKVSKKKVGFTATITSSKSQFFRDTF